MENSILEILTYYVIGGALLIGAPGVFFFVVFMSALQNTKGRMVGYKDHKTYGDSSIYENTSSDNTKLLPYFGTMNEKAERINGWAAMIGVIAAMGSVTQLLGKLSQVYGERRVNHFSVSHRRVYICCPIE